MKATQAIAKIEGFGVHVDGVPTIPTRTNNPGDIEAGRFANAHGAIPNAPDPLHPDHGPFRYAVFPDEQTGENALLALLRAHYVGMTARKLVYTYAPPSDSNDSEEYLDLFCKLTGLRPDSILTMEDIG